MTGIHRIHKLDGSVIQRIAAGEVIQRPCNAIKELLENSLDAGSSIINVVILDGGYKSFSIQDNGHGILKEDLPLLCERYATSKLRNIDDLRHLNTFGFRGEALSSISHISRLSVVTKTLQNNIGYKADYIDGKLVGEPSPVAANTGTLLTVQELFYNNPVRSTNMNPSSKNEEYLKIIEVVQRYAIIHAGSCTFSVRKGPTNAPDLLTRRESKETDVICNLFGTKVSDSLLPFQVPGLASGWVSNAYCQLKSFIFILFINGRLVDCPRLKRAIGNIYGQILLKQTFPFVYLCIKISPERIDVNVHPTKKEVIFMDEDGIIEQVSLTLRKTLTDVGVVQSFIPKIKEPIRTPEVISTKVSAIRPPNSSSTLLRSPKVTTTSPPYPFQQIHTDHRTRTLDYFIHKKSKLENPTRKDPLPIITNASNQNGSFPIITNASDQSDLFPIITNVTSQESTITPQMLIAKRDPLATQSSTILPQQTIPTEKGFQPDLDIPLSVKNLQSKANRNCGKEITQVIQRHSFVGVLDACRIFLQFETSLLQMDVTRVAFEWICLNILFSSGQVKGKELNPPADIQSSLELYLNSNPSILASTKVNITDLQKEIICFVESKSSTFELIGIKQSQGKIFTFPDLLGLSEEEESPLLLLGEGVEGGKFKYNLGATLFRASIECDWDDDEAFTSSLIKLIAEMNICLLDSFESTKGRIQLEYNILPKLRKLPLNSIGYPKILASNGAIVQVATTHELYKIFERC